MTTHPARTLQQWLNYIEQLHPNEIDLGLERVRIVAQKLNLLSPDATVITVAGTNGKGSCIAALDALLTAANKRVGAYTSPHILRYNERVKIGQQMVDDQSLCDAFAAIDKARGAISLTYFEYGTLAALLLFMRQPLDYWLLEVGLGGRLDAVNIIDADIAVFTPIDLDHQAYLGDTREQIAVEKAGILRPGQTVVCADESPPMSLIEAIDAKAEVAFYIGRDFYSHDDSDGGIRVGGILPLGESRLPTPNLPLPSVLAASKVMSLCLPALCDIDVLARVYPELALAGRMQSVFGRTKQGRTLEFVLDVAHNPHAMSLLAKRLMSLRGPDRRVIAVLAMMADKDIEAALIPLLPLVSHWILPCLAETPRAASPQEMRQHLLNIAVLDCKITPCKGMADALLLSVENESWQSPGSRVDSVVEGDEQYILVTGSFFTVAQATTVLSGDERG